MKLSDPRISAPPSAVQSEIQAAEDWARAEHPQPRRRKLDSVHPRNIVLQRQTIISLLFGIILTTGIGVGVLAWFSMRQPKTPNPELNQASVPKWERL